MYSNDNRKDGSYTVAWTRRIPGSLILTFHHSAKVHLSIEARFCQYPTLLMLMPTYSSLLANCILYLEVSLCDLLCTVCNNVCMYGMCGCVCVIAHTHTHAYIYSSAIVAMYR